MRPRLLVIFLAIAAALGMAVPASAAAGDVAVGVFRTNLRGVSVFTHDSRNNVTVNGAYARLDPNRAYFTVIYGNEVCDPAQAFPLGPFTTSARGRARFTKTAPAPAVVNVGQAGSISVRIGDDATDQDRDGKTGPTDVVAVAGQPSIGLVECTDALHGEFDD